MGHIYQEASKYLHLIDNGTWVEIGTEREDGSTSWLLDQASQHHAEFISVDSNLAQIHETRKLILGKTPDGTWPAHLELIWAKGDVFLSQWNVEVRGKISLLYLDNFDWDYQSSIKENSTTQPLRDYYQQQHQIEMSRLNSQLVHLQQAVAALPNLSQNCLVVCDDTWFDRSIGLYVGKCSAVIPYLMLFGFAVAQRGYQPSTGSVLIRCVTNTAAS